MSIKISHKKKISEKTIKNYVLFTNEDFVISGLKNIFLSKNSAQINKTIKSNKTKKNDIISFNLNSDQKIILIKIKKKF